VVLVTHISAAVAVFVVTVLMMAHVSHDGLSLLEVGIIFLVKLSTTILLYSGGYHPYVCTISLLAGGGYFAFGCDSYTSMKFLL